jgi:RNA-directed DNA polymerase
MVSKSDKEYFIERKFNLGVKMLSGKFKKVWENQKGKCPFCNLPMDISADAEERHLHHINGNHKDNKISNLVYVHVHCHKQYHANYPKSKRIITVI